MGEATSDTLVHQLAPVVAVALGAVGLVIALALQFAAPRYRPWIYWLAVVMVAVFGTMAADALHIELGIPYVVSTAAFTVVLIAVFLAWYSSEHTLSIHSITTRRRETFYWLTVIAMSQDFASRYFFSRGRSLPSFAKIPAAFFFFGSTFRSG
jgi:uncharacterized membrane-anchored protein